MNKLGIHRKCLKLVFVMITSNQIFDNRGCTDFWRVLKPEMEKMGTLKKNGDQMGTKNLILVPMGTKVPKWGPTWEQCKCTYICNLWCMLNCCKYNTNKIWSFSKTNMFFNIWVIFQNHKFFNQSLISWSSPRGPWSPPSRRWPSPARGRRGRWPCGCTVLCTQPANEY